MLNWNLFSLRKSGSREYRIATDYEKVYLFNICGTIGEACAPYLDERVSGILPPFSRGVAIQYLDSDSGPAGLTCIDSNTCDFESDPECTASTVHNVSCTPECELIAPYTGAAPLFSLLSESDPTGGITLRHEAVSAFAKDPFGSCPEDPRTGLPTSRSFTINLFCDENTPADDLTDMVSATLSSSSLQSPHPLLLSRIFPSHFHATTWPMQLLLPHAPLSSFLQVCQTR